MRSPAKSKGSTRRVDPKVRAEMIATVQQATSKPNQFRTGSGRTRVIAAG
jgi:hypothetical protein